MSSMETARQNLAEYDREVAARLATRAALEKTIAETEKTLAELDEGIGAPKDVPSYLKLKNDLRKRIDGARAELSTLNDEMIALGARHAPLVEALDRAVDGALVSLGLLAIDDLKSKLAVAAAAWTKVVGLVKHFETKSTAGAAAHGIGSPQSIGPMKRVESLALGSLPAAVSYIDLDRNLLERERRGWADIAHELANPNPEETSTAKAAE